MRNLKLREMLQSIDFGSGPKHRPAHDARRSRLERSLASVTRRLRRRDTRLGPRKKRSVLTTARQFWSWTRATALDSRRITRNAAADSLGSLLTISIDDWTVRAVLVTGNRVRNWSQAELPVGVVRDGTIADRRAFEKILRELVASFYEGSRITGRDVAIAIGGRTHVQARFTVAIDDETTLESAVLAAAEEQFSFDSSAVQIDWHASEIEPVEGGEDDPGDFTVEDDEEDVRTYDVYAFGVYRDVIESELRFIRQQGAWPVDARPRPLALAAAVNEERALILDLEPYNFSVIILRDGLPDIIFDIGVDPDVDDVELGKLAREQIDTTIGYHDSVNEEAPLPPDIPIIVTGALASRATLVRKALEGLPNPASPLPTILRADPEFPCVEYAANIGLATIAGLRPWQRPAVKRFSTPEFTFVPTDFPRRPRPARTLARGMGIAALILTVGLAIGQVSDAQSDNQHRTALSDELDKRVEERRAELRRAGILDVQIDHARTEADTVFAATGAITRLDEGFGEALTGVTSRMPRGVILRQLDDDGSLITATFSASTTSALLEFTRSLEASPEFGRIKIRSLSKTGGAESSRPPGVSAIPDLGGLSGLAGLGGLDGFDALALPPELEEPSPAAGLANFFTMSLRIARGEPQQDVPDVESVSAPPANR